MRVLAVGGQLTLLIVCLCTLFKLNIGTILVYPRQNGQIPTEPVYTIPNNNRSIVRQEFEDRDIVYLITANPGDACLHRLRRPPEHFEDRLPAKFILLIDDERCDHDEGFYVKIRSAQRKGYDGVIVHPAWINNERTEPFPVDLPDRIADHIKLNLDFIGYDYGVGLRKYEFRHSASKRYFLRFTKSVDGHEVKESQKSNTSVVTGSYKFGDIAMLIFIYSLLASPFIYLYCLSQKGTAEPAVQTAPVFVMGNQPSPAGDNAPSDEELEIGREESMRKCIDLLMAQVQAQEEQENSAAPHQPLTADEVKQLKVMQVTEVTEDICPVCQKQFALKERLMIPNCNHACHVKCLTVWLTMYSRLCPLCRQTIRPNN